jgi:hypothetical protein
MNDDEKKVLKQLGKMVSDLIYLKGVHEAVLKKHIKEWKAEVEVANASLEFQALRQKLFDRQKEVEKLVDENNLDALLTKVPKDGQVN